jgi:transposase
MVWGFQRLFVKAPSGRQRLNVLAALNAITHEVLTVQNLTYITAETVCELLRLLASSQPDMPVTVILDNARYQRCALVQTVAQTLGIELLYFPTYSPNLNLIERFWKFVKKQCLYAKYYPDSVSFQNTIMACIEQAPILHNAELERLLTLRFQTFQAVAVIGENHTVSKRSKKKVLSKAA